MQFEDETNDSQTTTTLAALAGGGGAVEAFNLLPTARVNVR
jgi:hypothetical protein